MILLHLACHTDLGCSQLPPWPQDIVAGDTVNLTCDYALTPSVDVTVSVTWIVNGSGIDTSKDGHVTSNGGQLIIFSP